MRRRWARCTLALMLSRRAHAVALAFGLVAVAAPPAHADVLPPPERPTWDQHPPPLPEPPPEKDMERAALAALACLALLGAAWARGRRTETERAA